MTPALLHDPVIDLAVRLGLAVLLGTAAFHKARDLGAFRDTLRDYDLLPQWTIAPMAPVVIALELSIAGSLAAIPHGVAGPLGAIVLLAVYSAAIGINLARGRREIDCGCLGPALRQPLSEWLLVRNGVVILGALVVIVPTSPRPLTWVDVLSLAGAVTTLSLIWISTNRLTATWRQLGRARLAR